MSEIDNLKKVVEKLHCCKASYVDQVAVIEKYSDKTVWSGIVYIFQLIENPQGSLCYAWSLLNPESKKTKYYAVLHIPPIDSPEKAVRASIVHDHKKISKTNISKER